MLGRQQRQQLTHRAVRIARTRLHAETGQREARRPGPGVGRSVPHDDRTVFCDDRTCRNGNSPALGTASAGPARLCGWVLHSPKRSGSGNANPI
jgi:hypothetical protein